jgi:uncharacterized protein YkwD
LDISPVNQNHLIEAGSKSDPSPNNAPKHADWIHVLSGNTSAARRAAALVSFTLTMTTTTVIGGFTVAEAKEATTASRAIDRLNEMRAAAGLAPVEEDPEASRAASLHNNYLLTNRVVAHDEQRGRPGYSAAGDRAGNTGNVWVQFSGNTSPVPLSTPADIVDDWMTSPFHALTLLQGDLTSVGFAADFRPNIGTAATMPVWYSANNALPAPPAAPVLFPGPDSVVPLSAYSGTEWPNPLAGCPDWNPTQPAGLPILVQLPSNEVFENAVIRHADEVIADCELGASTHFALDAPSANLARSILKTRNASVVVPKDMLIPGERYDIVVTTNQSSMSWSFTVAAGQTD